MKCFQIFLDKSKKMDFNSISIISFIEQKIKDLEKITDHNFPYTRLIFSKEFYEARYWLTQQFNLLNLSVSTDEAGNLIGLLESNIKTDKLVTIMVINLSVFFLGEQLLNIVTPIIDIF